MRPSLTRPQKVIDFVELLSELITTARMHRPHLSSRLVSAILACGIRWRTLSCEEWCGRMLANPVKTTCTSTTPQLSERRVVMRVHNRCTAGWILRSWLLESCCERGDHVVRGGRLLSVPSRWLDLQKPNTMEVHSEIRGGVLELAGVFES